MPTGYTEIIEKGATFEEYAWRCARAFGACMQMRDDCLDTPIPSEFHVNEYYIGRLESDKRKLASLMKMSPNEAAVAARREYDETVARNYEYRENAARNRSAYAEMKDAVERWEPPSRDHVGLKDFMLQQIDESTKWGIDGYQEQLPSLDPMEWLGGKIREAKEDVDYSRKRLDEETDRVNRGNEWLRLLRESIPQPPCPTPIIAST